MEGTWKEHGLECRADKLGPIWYAGSGKHALNSFRPTSRSLALFTDVHVHVDARLVTAWHRYPHHHTATS